MSYFNYMHTSSSTMIDTIDSNSIKKAFDTLNLKQENILKHTKLEKEKESVNVKIPTVLFDPEDLFL